MSSVKVIKFLSGQEIIAKVALLTAEEAHVEFPLTLQVMKGGDPRQPQVQVALLPFSWGSRCEKVELTRDHILCMLDPEEDLARQYVQATSGIIVPETPSPRLTLVE